MERKFQDPKDLFEQLRKAAQERKAQEEAKKAEEQKAEEESKAEVKKMIKEFSEKFFKE